MSNTLHSHPPNGYETGRDAGRPKSPWLEISKGRWTIHFPAYQQGSLRYGAGSLSHYGETWREHLDDLAHDAIGTDTRTISDEEIARFAVAGPLVDVTLPIGRIRQIHGRTMQWQDVPTDERDPRFGNADWLDQVALDVYLTILLRFGGRVFDPHAEGHA